MEASSSVSSDGATFAIFASPADAWPATEELELLEAVELYGFGNWEETALFIGQRSAEEVRDHFIAMYVEGPLGRLTWSRADTQSYRIVDHTTPKEGILSPALTTPLPAIPELSIAEQQHLGYLPKRDDLEREFDNEAEALISNLSMSVLGEEEVHVDLKLAHIDMYRRRLKDRFQKKAIARDYGLVSRFYKDLTSDEEFMSNMHLLPPLVAEEVKPSPSKKKYKSAAASDPSSSSESLPEKKDPLMDKFKVFAQFQSALDQKEFFDNLRREKELKARIRELLRFRRNGLKKLSEVVAFETARNKRDKKKENKKKEPPPTEVPSRPASPMASSPPSVGSPSSMEVPRSPSTEEAARHGDDRSAPPTRSAASTTCARSRSSSGRGPGSIGSPTSSNGSFSPTPLNSPPSKPPVTCRPVGLREPRSPMARSPMATGQAPVVCSPLRSERLASKREARQALEAATPLAIDGPRREKWRASDGAPLSTDDEDSRHRAADFAHGDQSSSMSAQLTPDASQCSLSSAMSITAVTVTTIKQEPRDESSNSQTGSRMGAGDTSDKKDSDEPRPRTPPVVVTVKKERKAPSGYYFSLATKAKAMAIDGDFDVESMPSARLLSKKEKSLCASLRLRPGHYIALKAMIVKEQLQKLKGSSTPTKSGLDQVDKNIRKRVTLFMMRSGWLMKGGLD